MAITHDRYFLDNVAGGFSNSTEVVPTHTRATSPPTWRLRPRASGSKGKGTRSCASASSMNSEWVRSNPKARQAKSKSRLGRYEEMAAEAERTNKLDFEEIQIPPGPRLGNIVVEATDLKGFDDRILIDNLSFSLPRNGIVGVIGPNGVGKTTLFKMIVGQEEPNSGTIKIGDTVSISYVDQSRGGIDPKKNVWEVVSDAASTTSRLRSKCPAGPTSAFGFKGPDSRSLPLFSRVVNATGESGAHPKIGGNLLSLTNRQTTLMWRRCRVGERAA